MSEIEKKWQKFLAQEESERAKYFMSNRTRIDGRVVLPDSIIFPRQFNRELLEYLFRLADAVRDLENVSDGARFLKSIDPLANKRVLHFFGQPSTRTLLSHQSASMVLGLPNSSLIGSETSSQAKGESRLDTMATLAEYADIIIIRDKEKDFVEKVAWYLKAYGNRPCPVINAGSYSDHHPTQAQLDYYTMHRWFKNRGGVEGKTILFVGDCRGRAVRSNAYLARNYPGVKLIFASPCDMKIGSDIQDYLARHDVSFEVTEDFGGAISEADVIYLTRVQNEYFEKVTDESKKYFHPDFALTPELMREVNVDTIIMHPLPRRGELPPELDNDPRVKIWSQTRNGMWMRVVNFLILFGVDQEMVRKSPEYFR